MAKVNVYLPDDLEQAVRDAGISISPVCQSALRDALDQLEGIRATGRGAYTERLSAILDELESDLGSKGRPVTPRELFGGIVQHGENLGARVLATLGVDLPGPKSGRAPKGTGELTPETRQILAEAARVALEMRHSRVGTEHVVIALAAEPFFADVFAALGITERSLRQQVERLLANPWTTERQAPAEGLLTLDRLDREVQRLAAELDRTRRDLDNP